MSVANRRQGPRSQDVLRLWGTRIQDMLHHIDPGIQDTPQEHLRTRWNYLHIAATGMMGQLDEAAASARASFDHVDHASQDTQNNELRAQMLQAYVVLMQAVNAVGSYVHDIDFVPDHADAAAAH